jgi:hypothetical protein
LVVIFVVDSREWRKSLKVVLGVGGKPGLEKGDTLFEGINVTILAIREVED